MVKVAFVILHYENIDDTVECIDTLNNNIGIKQSVQAIVVDNHSPNKSGDILSRKYERNNYIHFIKTEKNLGFANGNNIGYEHAKNAIDAKFIVIINADTLINQKDFVAKLESIYTDTNFDILGPKILSSNGQNQNPVKSIISSKTKVKKHITYNLVLYLLSYFYLDELFQKCLTKKRTDITKDTDKRQVGCKLHGSALIFSPKFIANNSYAFDPRTFMYMEEDILYAKVKNQNLITVYDPDIHIYHKEDGSLNLSKGKGSPARRFVYSSSIQSSLILHKILNK